VVSTNARELGIDVGGLDAAVVAGFPGSFNSFWQQSGRSGRRGGESVAIFVASSSPLDQFIMQNPDWFFRKSAEEAHADPDNPYIFTDHVKCAAFELPFRDEALEEGASSPDPFGPAALEALSLLEEEGILRHTPGTSGEGRWYWADRSYPAEGVGLRSAGADNVVIIDVTGGRNQVIGEMDRPSAKELIFEKAVYIHRGRQYMVESLDISARKALVREAEVNYYTDGLSKTDIKVLSEDERFDGGSGVGAWGEGLHNEGDQGVPLYTAVLGDVLVRTQVTKFKKIRFHTNENIGYGEINLPEEEMHTRALALLFGPEGAGGRVLGQFDEEAVGTILSGTASLIRTFAPIFLLCDSRDLGLSERVRDPHFGVPAIYIYDRYPGGAGLSEALAPKTGALLTALDAALQGCPCRSGCPSCVGAGGNKAGTAAFLRAIARQRVSAKALALSPA
jgi:DEAD/DEAH box helicase domain-containing protein